MSKDVKKIMPIFVAIVLIIGGCSFYGGMKYGESKSKTQSLGAGAGNVNFRNLTPDQRQQFAGQGGGAFVGRTSGTNGTRNGGGFVNGDVLSKDDTSITVKMRDGSSKIVFYSGSTEISKFDAGSSDDIKVGESVMVNGQTNSDGSVTAQSIQIRPAAPAPATAPAQ